MSWMDISQIKVLGRFLDITGARHTLIASNLANIDTPGYRTLDIHFEDEMKRTLSGLDQEDIAPPQAYDVPGLIERPDGNNVSLDRESILLAQTQLQFRMGVELLREEFQHLQSAIKEGG